MEVTFQTESALESNCQVAKKVFAMLLGAGTVINREQAHSARGAGAQFIVSLGLDEGVVIWAQKNDVPILPGAVTPTEIMRALNLGLNLLKFFPAETWVA